MEDITLMGVLLIGYGVVMIMIGIVIGWTTMVMGKGSKYEDEDADLDE